MSYDCGTCGQTHDSYDGALNCPHHAPPTHRARCANGHEHVQTFDADGLAPWESSYCELCGALKKTYAPIR